MANTIRRSRIFPAASVIKRCHLCCFSEAKLCPALCSPMDYSIPGSSGQYVKHVIVISNCSQDGEKLVRIEATQEGKNTCHLAAVKLKPLPAVNQEEAQ